MKEDKPSHLILTIILCLNAGIILFPSNFKFIPIVFLVFFSFYCFKKTKKMNVFYFVFASTPYFLLIVGMFYTKNITYGIKFLETEFSLLLYPLCFALLPKELLKWQVNNRLNYILGVFCFSIFIFSSCAFLYFIIFENRSLDYVIQHYNILIDKSIYPKYQIHSIYLALNVGISLIFSFFLIKKQKKYILKLLTLINILFAILLLAFLNKRMAIIALFIVFLIHVVLELKKIRIKKLTLVYYVALSAVVIIGVIFMPRYKNQNSFHEFNNIVTTINDPETSIGKRVFLYKSAFKLFLKNPLLGVGTGDANEKLSNELAILLQTKSENYNTHNQYLSYLISLGLFGFIIFICYIFYVLKISLISNEVLMFYLFVFLCLNMMSENILERESGVLIYAFFLNFFLKLNLNSDNKSIKLK
ncbi:hypothetical protein LPB03_08440 [Polaribacter vadi]|uniref:O-antigen ligase-related domain-containing protein n=1 Tax=Polaribacter vadi TaxID=1774273 RepID=A0A1B8U2S6_9FLAO|nr:O-antigen ligase family protein [Polaribacter vadi]AOW17492.1 hypothetical protein LPB03_08440 [Polaribacter vadi]OBY66183.1 hypothetical protein LPB3_01825 [Polaribacter vadi]